MKFFHPELTWKEFEDHCEEILFSCVDQRNFRINIQHSRQYSDGNNYRMDCHIAEKRVGGKGLVVDFKHFPIAKLNRNEILTTENYRKMCKASAAVIMYSYQSNFTKDFFDVAKRYNIYTYQVDFSRISKVKGIVKGIFTKGGYKFDPGAYLK